MIEMRSSFFGKSRVKIESHGLFSIKFTYFFFFFFGKYYKLERKVRSIIMIKKESMERREEINKTRRTDRTFLPPLVAVSSQSSDSILVFNIVYVYIRVVYNEGLS